MNKLYPLFCYHKESVISL